jgi:hypothetical protein
MTNLFVRIRAGLLKGDKKVTIFFQRSVLGSIEIVSKLGKGVPCSVNKAEKTCSSQFKTSTIESILEHPG